MSNSYIVIVNATRYHAKKPIDSLRCSQYILSLSSMNKKGSKLTSQWKWTSGLYMAELYSLKERQNLLYPPIPSILLYQVMSKEELQRSVNKPPLSSERKFLTPELNRHMLRYLNHPNKPNRLAIPKYTYDTEPGTCQYSFA